MRPRRRRLWQQNSPIAPYSGSSDDDSPGDLSDADESNYSDGSVGSNFMPESLKSQQYTNISDFPSPVDEDSIIEPVENPHQEGNIIETIENRCYGFLLLHYPESLPATLDTISILLIYQRRPHGLPPYWGFPKGHPEPEDHSDWESASRELLEETGLSPDRVTPITPAGFSPPLPDSVAGLRPDFMSVISQYPSFDGGIKEVTYFLARVAEMEKLTEQVEELVESG
ncbi:hypothetical protein VE04_02687 [Pseudogymnoascus sp. 24MN13]|nr:hypothetical protein VE04_02687 [Pseudogymnoascus sp. 24MN13]